MKKQGRLIVTTSYILQIEKFKVLQMATFSQFLPQMTDKVLKHFIQHFTSLEQL